MLTKGMSGGLSQGRERGLSRGISLLIGVSKDPTNGHIKRQNSWDTKRPM